eukprot:scpid59218/ scgid27019/ Zinc finger SWIM domain-containing protein KIAA0913
MEYYSMASERKSFPGFQSDKRITVNSQPTSLNLYEWSSEPGDVDWESFNNLLVVHPKNLTVIEAGRSRRALEYPEDGTAYTEECLGPSFGLGSAPVYFISEEGVVVDYRPDVADPEEERARPAKLQRICSKYIARTIPFAGVEQILPKLSLDCQSMLMRYSFPTSLRKIHDYCCLSTGDDKMFKDGMQRYHLGFVFNVQQIGLYVLGEVKSSSPGASPTCREHVTVVCAEQVICESQCTCCNSKKKKEQKTMWCEHIVAVCAFRIMRADTVTVAAPFSESLPHLNTLHLMQILQFLIQDGDSQFLAKVQKLVTQVKTASSAIAECAGVPDKTSGPIDPDCIRWSMDSDSLRSRLVKAVHDMCKLINCKENSPQLTSHLVDYPGTVVKFHTLCTSGLEYFGLGFYYDITSSHEKPRQPHGLWYVLRVVKHLLADGMSNSIEVLQCMTEAIVENPKFWLIWEAGMHGFRAKHTLQEELYHSIASLCEQVVRLWLLVVLEPSLKAEDLAAFRGKLSRWQSSMAKQSSKNPEQWSVRQKRQWRQVHNTTKLCAIGPDFRGLQPVLDALAAGWHGWPLDCLVKCGKQLLIAAADIVRDKESHFTAGMSDVLELCRNDSLLVLQSRWKVLHMRQQPDAAIGLALCIAKVLLESQSLVVSDATATTSSSTDATASGSMEEDTEADDAPSPPSPPPVDAAACYCCYCS